MNNLLKEAREALDIIAEEIDREGIPMEVLFDDEFGKIDKVLNHYE